MGLVLSGVSAVGVLLVGIGSAKAQVHQTDTAQTPLPQPVGAPELNLVGQSYGWNAASASYKDPLGTQLLTPILFGEYYAPPAFPQFVDGDAITLQGLFKWRGEHLDPVRDARTTPGHFLPTCAFSVELVLKGGNCNAGFGWYNVVNGASSPPAASDIHELIPRDPSYLHCVDQSGAAKTDGFCPLAWDNRNPRNLSQQAWTLTSFPSGNIKSDPSYLGGDIGFALVGNPSTPCSQSKY